MKLSNPFVATLRLLGFVLWSLVAVPPFMLLNACGWTGMRRYVCLYFRVINRMCGFSIRQYGHPVTERRPALFVANHASYLDILILGSLLDAVFVAKSEVSGWPGLGFLARISRTAFMDRKRGATKRERDGLQDRLQAGESLIVFPEGTSNDGNSVLPFRSSLFSLAGMTAPDGQPITVQPISVAYTQLDGLPMTRALRCFYAWYGDMTLVDHLFQAMGLGRVTVDVVYHAPVRLDQYVDRKALSNHCHDVVAHGMSAALNSRLDPAKLPILS